MVTQVQEKPTDWYLNKTNCDEMSRQVKDAWMLAVERISSIVATVNTSRENVSHRIVNSGKDRQPGKHGVAHAIVLGIRRCIPILN